MIAITGNVFGHLIGSDAFQETDIVGICEPIVKHSYFIEKAADIPRILAEAFHLAKSGRPGPVLVDIPKSVQVDEASEEIVKKLESKEDFDFDLPGYSTQVTPDNGEIEKTIKLIKSAKRPVVIFGHGVTLANAEKELLSFLEKTRIPASWTLHGIGGLDPKNPLALGMLGMHGLATANYAVHNADIIIGLGIRFDDRITGIVSEFQKDTKIIHFDIDESEFNKIVHTASCIAGDLKNTLPLVTKKISQPSSQEWLDELHERKIKWPLDGDKPGKLTEIKVINELNKLLEEDDILVVDVGQHEMWTAQRSKASKPKKFLASGGLGTMGFSLPSAMGACFSGHKTWSISGDGGIQMNIQELGTIAQDNIPVKIIILNNGFLGMVRQWQDLFYKKNYVDTPLWNPDFVKIGEAYSIPSFQASTPEDAVNLLNKMNEHNGPILGEFVVEREENVFPMVPAGAHLGDTLLCQNRRLDTD